jgi:hypothetical protein
MLIIGCGFHTRYQRIAMVDTATGELTERRSDQENGEAGGKDVTERERLVGAAPFV